MKNWYGILGGQRPQLHQHIHESLVDLADLIRPTLTLVDSYRILLRNGPTGGNLEDVLLKKTLIGPRLLSMPTSPRPTGTWT
jgi:uncharacterized protein (DUF362 family)